MDPHANQGMHDTMAVGQTSTSVPCCIQGVEAEASCDQLKRSRSACRSGLFVGQRPLHDDGELGPFVAWNKSMFPPDKQPIIEKELIDCFVPKDGSAEDVGIVIDIMDSVAERREELFPDLRKVIVDYEVDISSDQLNLNVTSAPVPDVG